MNPHPSPFPASPAAAALRGIGPIGPIGGWEGDETEGAAETAAAQVRQPSVLSQVIAGERIQVRPRCGQCGSLLLRDAHDASWCPSCVSGEVEGDGVEKTAIPAEADGVMREVTLNGPLDAHGLAALPVTLSPRVLEAHEELVRKTHPEEVEEWEMEVAFNPSTGAFDAMMNGEVMQMLRAMGPSVRIKGRF